MQPLIGFLRGVAGQARNRVGSVPEGSALARSVRLGPASVPWRFRSDIVSGDAHPFPLIIAGSMDEIDVLGLARPVIANTLALLPPPEMEMRALPRARCERRARFPLHGSMRSGYAFARTTATPSPTIERPPIIETSQRISFSSSRSEFHTGALLCVLG